MSHTTWAAKSLREVTPEANVITFNSGEQAIEHLTACGGRWKMPDLVLVDWRMPGGMDGFDVLRAIRELEHLDGLAVVMTSGSDAEEHICRAADLGAGYVIKPGDRDGYKLYAQQIEDYRRQAVEQLLVRRLCGAGVELRLPMAAALSSSTPAMSNSIALPGASVVSFLARALEYFGGSPNASGEGLFGDRKLAELTRACREVGVDEIDVLTPSKDAVIVIKRRRVVLRLMDAEWSNPEIMRRVPVKDRYLDELRAEWNRQKRVKSAELVRGAKPKTLE